MINNTYWLKLILSCCLCVLLNGCISTKYVERQHYLFDVPNTIPPQKKHRISHKCVVFIDDVVAIAPFDQPDFLYRISSDQYLVDYYNGFLVTPSEQLDSILRNYLKVRGNFSLYIDSSLAKIKNRLYVKLVELYADYRNRDDPRAVIAINFVLIKQNAGNSVILFDQTLRSSISLCRKNTKSLLRGWNIGIKNILNQAIHILNRRVKW